MVYSGCRLDRKLTRRALCSLHPKRDSPVWTARSCFAAAMRSVLHVTLVGGATHAPAFASRIASYSIPVSYDAYQAQPPPCEVPLDSTHSPPAPPSMGIHYT
jgi:hypothetical protein